MGELLALKEAVESAKVHDGLNFELDSKYTIDQVTKNLQRNEDSGYITVFNAPLVELTVVRLRKRKTHTKIKWVKGHSGHAQNDGADKFADHATRKPERKLDMTIEPTLKVTGAKLSKLTQALAIKAISAKKRKLKWNQRECTKRNLEHTKDCCEEIFRS